MVIFHVVYYVCDDIVQARLIQNNVRGWLLRRNFVNLRNATMTLQSAWRERGKRPHQRRRGTVSGKRSLSSDTNDDSGSTDAVSSVVITSRDMLLAAGAQDTIGGAGSGGLDVKSPVDVFDADAEAELRVKNARRRLSEPDSATAAVPLQQPQPEVDSAVATLQALTRGMLARKSFRNIRRQAMASLVIQRSLVEWWKAQKTSHDHVEADRNSMLHDDLDILT